MLERALTIVQPGVSAAGLKGDWYRLSDAQAGWVVEDDPVVNVQWRGTWTEESVYLHPTDLAEAVVDVASHVAQGFIQLEGIYLPTCTLHRVRAKASLDDRRVAVWLCRKRGVTPHPLACIGGLAELSATQRRGTPSYLRLGELSSP